MRIVVQLNIVQLPDQGLGVATNDHTLLCSGLPSPSLDIEFWQQHVNAPVTRLVSTSKQFLAAAVPEIKETIRAPHPMQLWKLRVLDVATGKKTDFQVVLAHRSISWEILPAKSHLSDGFLGWFSHDSRYLCFQ